MKFWTKTPHYIQKAFPKVLWKGSETQSLYLTFDDGPTPGVTDWVLDLLAEQQAKATFFCIGERVKAAPALYQRILDEGHAVGNHTHTHPNGWYSDDQKYFQEIESASKWIDSPLFRPPYGKLKFSQYQHLKSRYQIVMWDIITWDFAPSTSKETCWENVERNIEDGSVIVYHDKESCFEKLKHNLPKLLAQYGEAYTFRKIEI